jgi:hypothetical protein
MSGSTALLEMAMHQLLIKSAFYYWEALFCFRTGIASWQPATFLLAVHFCKTASENR